MTAKPVDISVSLDDAHAHLFCVDVVIHEAFRNQELSLPVWTPGSYMVREHAQHIVSISAYLNDTEVAIDKTKKNWFRVQNGPGCLRVSYKVYGFDSSIRAAYIDNQQAFFNGTSLFLNPHGFEKGKFSLKLIRPNASCARRWQVATGMPQVKCDEDGFGFYQAGGYEELVDYPFQVSELKRLKFEAAGVPHEMVLVGDVRAFDEDCLASDLTKLCSKHISMFGSKPPFDNYLFIARFCEGGYGGLEHQNSTMLLSSPYSLPQAGRGCTDENYVAFLGLCSHEYFHSWNVKRLKPKSFAPYNFDQECYTNMLWVFEGVTSYYDDLMLRKSVLVSQEKYLQILSKNISRLLANGGRNIQSLSESSFDAWIKFYRQNENSKNCLVSYYLKGSLVALLIDLSLRKNSNNERCLDDAMKLAFAKYGDGQGVSEEQFISCLVECGLDNEKELREKFIYGTDELPLKEMLSAFGVDCQFGADETYIDGKTKMHAYLGCNLRLDDNQRVFVSFVESDGPAMKAGLSANDEIVAINNVRIDNTNYSSMLGAIKPMTEFSITYARNKRMENCSALAFALPLYACDLKIKEDISTGEKYLLDGWLSMNTATN